MGRRKGRMREKGGKEGKLRLTPKFNFAIVATSHDKALVELERGNAVLMSLEDVFRFERVEVENEDATV